MKLQILNHLFILDKVKGSDYGYEPGYASEATEPIGYASEATTQPIGYASEATTEPIGYASEATTEPIGYASEATHSSLTSKPIRRRKASPFL